MKRALSIIILFLVFMFSCGNDVVYVDYTGTIEDSEYWYATLDATLGTFLSMDFQVLSGSEVDVIWMDQNGFKDFQERIIVDTLFTESYELFPESYAADFGFFNTGDEVVYSYQWANDSYPALPVDIFIMNQDNYNFFIQNLPYEAFAIFDSVTYVNDTLEVPMDDYIYFIIDNTVLHGSPPQGYVFYYLVVGQLVPSAFQYFNDISFLDCDSSTNIFQVPPADTLYLVVNNGGYVANGSTPTGSVQFHVFVKEE